MDYAYIVPLLALITLLLVLIFALVSKRRAEKRRRDPDVSRSSLASERPSHGRGPPDA